MLFRWQSAALHEKHHPLGLMKVDDDNATSEATWWYMLASINFFHERCFALVCFCREE